MNINYDTFIICFISEINTNATCVTASYVILLNWVLTDYARDAVVFKGPRRLWQILNDTFLIPQQKILDFSPSRSLYRVMKKGDYFYISSDVSGDFISETSYDIMNIDSEEESYNLIICYHILEHIENDTMAMKELWRVLKKDGYCLIQTPFKEGEIFEDYSVTTPEEREIYFGQSDHVRIYSVYGLKNRLENVGFTVEVRNYIEKQDNIYGFSERETVLICYKPEKNNP
jgi:SAM-dependent methyltransferase